MNYNLIIRSKTSVRTLPPKLILLKGSHLFFAEIATTSTMSAVLVYQTDLEDLSCSGFKSYLSQRV